MTLATLVDRLPSRLVPFLGVGTVGFCVDAGLTLSLAAAGLGPLAARLPAAGAAITTTYALNRRVTFRSRDPSVRAQFLRYLLVNGVGASLNLATYAALVATLPAAPWRLFVALVAGTAAGLVFNYLGARRFAFAAPATLAREGEGARH